MKTYSSGMADFAFLGPTGQYQAEWLDQGGPTSSTPRAKSALNLQARAKNYIYQKTFNLYKIMLSFLSFRNGRGA